MIINLRTLDCLTNSPCQIHWNYIKNRKALSYIVKTSYYLNVYLHNIIMLNCAIWLKLQSHFLTCLYLLLQKKKKNRIQRTSTKRESNQGNAIETMKAKPSGKERLWHNHAGKAWTQIKHTQTKPKLTQN